ncbi:MAG: hypothetical protein E4H14_06930 [Candidatus Thorarchaeota archaeon]|nr:MAG: hypothetical protein E4H14_06930 [Candidatus Thorarchaeota archaeon]
MNAEMKKHLEAVVVAIANEQAGDAKSAFSQYLRLKTQAILLGEEEDADDKDDKDDDKDDKKPAFLKKDKKDKDEDDKDEDKDDDKDEDKDED